MRRKLIDTEDGSKTLYVPGLDEHYHSRFGAITESRHIFIEAAFEYSGKDPVRVLEFGMGTGLNVLLSYEQSIKETRTVYYHAVEKYPVTAYEINNLSFTDHIKEADAKIFQQIHESEWGCETCIGESFTLLKTQLDFREFETSDRFDVIYFDAFSPEVQPELWTERMFQKIASFSNPGTVLTTYSSKGLVKRHLIAAGFSIEKLPGPPGKREFLRAIKNS
jgi:tRNA U34 5-methylaminomethyl-2-thiouridine-forming methyltransferase MnmC